MQRYLRLEESAGGRVREGEDGGGGGGVADVEKRRDEEEEKRIDSCCCWSTSCHLVANAPWRVMNVHVVIQLASRNGGGVLMSRYAFVFF